MSCQSILLLTAALEVALRRLHSNGEAPPADDRRAAVRRAHRLIQGGSPDPRSLELIRGVPRVGPDALAEVWASLVERYVAKWGEIERAASECSVRDAAPTVGLALNKLAYFDPCCPDEYMSAQATVMMTDADVNCLRQGG